jgi:teichuronic acid biosynthesis glycosyltransferase TuaH
VDVVFTFSVEMLEDAVRREFNWPSDQTLLALARDDRVGRLLVADPWRSYGQSTARRRPLRLIEPISLHGRAAVRVRPHRLRRFDSTRPSTVARSYRSYGRLLGKALALARGEARALPRSAALVTYNPFVAAYCDAPWIGNIIYCGQDDWATGESVRAWWDAYLDAYRRIDDRGATIYAVSEELARRISPRANVVPNGVNAEVWRPRYPGPARITDLPRPRAIYTGTIDDRLETRLVELTAGAVGSLIMMGRHPDPSLIRWLRSIDNVHVFDSVDQVELAATVQACDLGLIPHRDQAAIRAMSPIKLYEYLAGGLPVVSVDLPPIRGVADDRIVRCNPEEWSEATAEALRKPPVSEEVRLRLIDEIAWSSRMQPVVDAAVAEPTTVDARTPARAMSPL